MRSLKSYLSSAKKYVTTRSQNFNQLTRLYISVEELQKREKNHIKDEIGLNKVSEDFFYIIKRCRKIVNTLEKDYKQKRLCFNDDTMPKGKEHISCEDFLLQVVRLEGAGKHAITSNGTLLRYRAIRILKPYYIQLLQKYKTISNKFTFDNINIDDDIQKWTNATQYEVFFDGDS